MNDSWQCSHWHQKRVIPSVEECMAPADGPCPTNCHGFATRCTQTRARHAHQLCRIQASRPVGLLVRLTRMGVE